MQTQTDTTSTQKVQDSATAETETQANEVPASTDIVAKADDPKTGDTKKIGIKQIYLQLRIIIIIDNSSSTNNSQIRTR